MRKVVAAIISICIFLITPNAQADDQLVVAPQLPVKFFAYAESAKLANPGFLMVNPVTATDLYNQSGEVGHIPASVFKLVSTFTALHILDPERSFSTALFATSKKGRVVLQGSRDPWLTSDLKLAKKNNQLYLPGLVMKGKVKSSRYLTIEHTGLFVKDITDLTVYLRKHGVSPKFIEVSPEEAKAHGTELISTVTSRQVSEMAEFAILWSDNQLADRLLREAARHENVGTTQVGLQEVVVRTLSGYGISTNELYVVDGSGLATENKVSPRTIVEILIEVRKNPKFSAIFSGLPISGETGTLKNRFVTTGTSAVGLVRAKTGWLNNVVSLAGYVTVGNEEYVFAIIADGINPGFSNRNRARDTIYALLGTIATP